MFTGEYQYKVDDKGRIPFPPKFRDALKGGLILSRGLGWKCINVYPIGEWEKVSEKLAVLPGAGLGETRKNRYMFGGGNEAEFDGQGRVSLPPILRQYAGIDKDAVIVGTNNYLEIWSKENWDRELEEMMSKMSEEAQQQTDPSEGAQ